MLKIILFSLFLSNAFAVEVGSEITYSVRSLGSSDSYEISETVIERDEDFDSHKVQFDSPSTGYSNWRRDSIYNEEVVREILDRCENIGGEYSIIEVNERPYTTCKINGSLTQYYTIYNVFTDLVFSYNATYWIGEGPYNGIFRVTDYFKNEVFKIVSFQ